jgi:glucose-6-phosphate isomerase
LANSCGYEVLEKHDPLVGGRFSAPSIVGLLPATIAGRRRGGAAWRGQ